jgi:hypothetical protein
MLRGLFFLSAFIRPINRGTSADTELTVSLVITSASKAIPQSPLSLQAPAKQSPRAPCHGERQQSNPPEPLVMASASEAIPQSPLSWRAPAKQSPREPFMIRLE